MRDQRDVDQSKGVLEDRPYVSLKRALLVFSNGRLVGDLHGAIPFWE